MSKDLEYFTEFLENPAASDNNEFHRMAREWGRYILAHKDEFDYLRDDEWKEVRERLLDELYRREDEGDAEYDAINLIAENSRDLSYEELIEFGDRKLRFMKNYQVRYNFPDEEIAEVENINEDFRKKYREAKKADEKLRRLRQKYRDSIAKLDDELVEFYRRTGKIPFITRYRDKKNHKGN